MRDVVFLSHANPEDNEFALWLALQLANEGYRVWCDLTQLLGGEDFWHDAETAIRERTAKLIYILSRASNAKEGPLQELQVAKNIARDGNLPEFIIPALIDDLPYRQFNIQLARINAIPFVDGWAKALQMLLAKLEKDGVPRSPNFCPMAVASWWRARFSAEQGILNVPEDYFTNWFPIRSLPCQIHFHQLRKSGIGRLDIPPQLPYPAFPHNRFIVSFAPAEDFAGQLGSSLSIEDSYSVPVTGPETELPALRSLDRRQTRDFVVRLLAMAWDQMIRERRLPTYELSNRARCFYFTTGLAQNDSVSFTRADGRRTFRKVVGQKGLSGVSHQATTIRFWHFGVQAKPLVYPTAAYIIKPHVLFSDDGSQIWDSKRRLHRARRSQCRNWWNPEWRDRILATMAWLAVGNADIEVGLGTNLTISVSRFPRTFTSPVCYRDPEREVPPFERELDDLEDEEVDEAPHEDERA
jgi:hypothetical protein